MSSRCVGVVLAAWVLLGATKAPAADGRLQHTGVVNLNTASAAELELLPGVGEKAALRIIALRERRPFQRVEELVRVKGFGRKRFLKLKLHLAVAGPTTLKVERVRAQPAPTGGGGPAAQR